MGTFVAFVIVVIRSISITTSSRALWCVHWFVTLGDLIFYGLYDSSWHTSHRILFLLWYCRLRIFLSITNFSVNNQGDINKIHKIKDCILQKFSFFIVFEENICLITVELNANFYFFIIRWRQVKMQPVEYGQFKDRYGCSMFIS